MFRLPFGIEYYIEWSRLPFWVEYYIDWSDCRLVYYHNVSVYRYG